MANTIIAGGNAYRGQATTLYKHDPKDVSTASSLQLSTEQDVSGAGFTVKKYDGAAWETHFGGASRARKAYNQRAAVAVSYQLTQSGWSSIAAGRRSASGADIARLNS